VVATNRKARHDYSIEDTLEAGIVLIGSEIKSIRAGPYDPASRYGHEPRRKRKLLLHKREIARLERRVQEKGYTLVPLRLYLKGNLAKVELALARGKRQYDKRAAIAEREARRRAERAIREREQEIGH
jgi:SsrA-binding protein